VSTGSEIRDVHGLGRYIRERILPLRPKDRPVPFRGRAGGPAEMLPFFDDMAAALREEGAVWSVTGPAGSGKTHLARHAAAAWGERFLADPDREPAVLWLEAAKLRDALRDERSLPGGPFAFALAAQVPGLAPETLARLIAQHPFIAIVDKDESPELEDWKLELPMGLGRLRVLHLALQESLGGNSIRLGGWDRETAVLAFHGRHGVRGMEMVAALEASPAAELLGYPLFAGWLLERAPALAAIADGSCVFDFLRELHGGHGPQPLKYGPWCAELLAYAAPPQAKLAARKLHGGAGGNAGWGTVFLAFLLGEALRQGNWQAVLEARSIEASVLALLERMPLGPEVKVRLGKEARPRSHIEKVNLANLFWRLSRTPVPERLLGQADGLCLPGHHFPRGLHRLNLKDSDLSGASLGKPRVRSCKFQRTSFRGANLAGVHLRACRFEECAFELADLSGAQFLDSFLEAIDLSAAIQSTASFHKTSFLRVTFGSTRPEDTPLFTRSNLLDCDLARLAAAGLRFQKTLLNRTSLAGLAVARLEAENTTFTRCDLMALNAPGARMHGVTFNDCILADVVLTGADLRDARFTDVEFQPGPASRAGLTGEGSRWDALHGSKSGFYAQDVAEGVYADPELTRTADLRGADLRGAKFERTDLFRVDLRGARLDPPVRAAALRMQAFVD
jgi:uncharacterized protein YjbI with pentapeptide repeats